MPAQVECSELCWSKHVDFSVAIASLASGQALLGEDGHPLGGNYDTLKPPEDDPEAFQESLRETAKWVLSDLDLEEN
jgi:hypothetical protein